MIEDARADLAYLGLTGAIQQHRDDLIYEHLALAIQYQGIKDSVASAYIKKHGGVSSKNVRRSLECGPLCPKLQSYWHFNDCGFRKNAGTCNAPCWIATCPVPAGNLRHGALGQAVLSLHFFMRDVADGDFVTWIDNRLEQADRPNARDRIQRLGASVVEPMRHIFGISDKVLNMTLAHLLLGGDPARERWIAAGSGMIAVDRLIHNMFSRQGILRRLNSAHAYGAQCYGPQGCAAIIERVSWRIDARQFNPDNPKVLPRLIQRALWRFGASDELDTCNGNRITDTERCKNVDCRIYRDCSRVPLKSA